MSSFSFYATPWSCGRPHEGRLGAFRRSRKPWPRSRGHFSVAPTISYARCIVRRTTRCSCWRIVRPRREGLLTPVVAHGILLVRGRYETTTNDTRHSDRRLRRGGGV